MTGVIDELMTPGCPHCAIKHLSAALYHKAHLVGGGEDLRPDPYMVDMCTAYINLVEVRTGYHSHFWYAVGALVRAEERTAPRSAGGCVAREARLMLEQYGEDALADALRHISVGTIPTHADWAAAHYSEAMRELPAMQAAMRMDDLVDSIERVRKTYFDIEEAPATSTEAAERGGESIMAKAAKKAAPAFLAKGKEAKGAKAACKGGKTAKAACKGGKCKK